MRMKEEIELFFLEDAPTKAISAAKEALEMLRERISRKWMHQNKRGVLGGREWLYPLFYTESVN